MEGSGLHAQHDGRVLAFKALEQRVQSPILFHMPNMSLEAPPSGIPSTTTKNALDALQQTCSLTVQISCDPPIHCNKHNKRKKDKKKRLPIIQEKSKNGIGL